MTAVLRTRRGEVVPLPIARWVSPPAAEEELVLRRAVAPVLDVGCGPGRHVIALGRRGVMALGVDVSADAVAIARGRGAMALHRSIFDRLPGVGPARRRALIRHFGSADRFLAATQEELEGVPGIPPRTARAIYAQLHKAGRG